MKWLGSFSESFALRQGVRQVCGGGGGGEGEGCPPIYTKSLSRTSYSSWRKKDERLTVERFEPLLGHDELHPRVLKELATELGPIFTDLFQQSIDSGDIPIRSGHLQTLVPCSRRVIDHLLAIIVPFP